MRLLWPCRLRLVGGRQPPSWEAPNFTQSRCLWQRRG